MRNRRETFDDGEVIKDIIIDRLQELIDRRYCIYVDQDDSNIFIKISAHEFEFNVRQIDIDNLMIENLISMSSALEEMGIKLYSYETRSKSNGNYKDVSKSLSSLCPQKAFDIELWYHCSN